MVLAFCIAITSIIVAVPFLQDSLYDWSLEFIRSLKPYHTQNLTTVMNVFAFIGDGELLFLQYFVLIILGRTKDYIFGTISLIFALHFINWLKLQIRHSRP